MSVRGATVLLAGLVAVLAAPPAAAGAAASPGAGPPLAAAGVSEHLGAALPLDLSFRDEQGRAVRLGDYFRDRPVVLVLGYYRCRMLCGLVIDGAAAALRGLGARPQLVSVSVDPRDDPASAARRQAGALASLGWPASRWPFLTGGEREVRALADAVGFDYRYDPDTDQYSHPALLTVATPGGRISSYLYGISFDGADLSAALAGARAGRLRETRQPLLLRCFHYVPSLRRYAGSITAFLRIGGVLILVAMGLGLLALRRTEAARRGGS
jgi:protein SCO1